MLDFSDKEGGRSVGDSSNNTLADLIFSYGLVDLGFCSNPSICSNRQPEPYNIRAQLDKALVDGDWRLLFPGGSVRYLEVERSDYSPILLDTIGHTSSVPKLFRFEARWTLDG